MNRITFSAPETSVTLYDLETRQKTEVPKSELPSDYMRAQIKGVEGVVWVDPNKMRPSQPRHVQLPYELKRKIKQIKQYLDEVHFLSSAKWEYGFRCNQHPEAEIDAMLKIGRVYQQIKSSVPWGASKKHYYSFLCYCSMTTKDRAMLHSRYQHIPSEQREMMAEVFYGSEN